MDRSNSSASLAHTLVHVHVHAHARGHKKAVCTVIHMQHCNTVVVACVNWEIAGHMHPAGLCNLNGLGGVYKGVLLATTTRAAVCGWMM